MIANSNRGVVIGALAIMLAALLWSIDGTFIRPQLYSIPAGLVVFLEHGLGLIVLSPFIFIYWHKIRTLRKRDWQAIFWVSAIGGVAGTLFITKAFFAAINGEVSFATVIILQKLQPVFALIMARLILRERLDRKFYLWAGLAIVAAYFLAFGKTGLDANSITVAHSAALFAVIAAFAFGSSTVFGKRVVNHLSFAAAAALRFGITTILSFALILATKDLGNLASVSSSQWGYLSLIVFTSGALALFVYYYGLRKVSASAATICELFWPFSAVILDYIINKNILNSVQLISALAMLLAIYFAVRTGRPKTVGFEARVISGLGRGSRMGQPTINLDAVDADIRYGIYQVAARINNRILPGVLHFGRKETFKEGASMELVVKDHIPDLADKKINIKIEKHIRDIKKFESADELKDQIKKDMKNL